MLTLNLRPIFEARGIERPYSFLVKAGLASVTAHNLLNNKSSSIRFDHLELLCRLLVCEPSDLFIWRPNKQDAIPSNHPLYNLKEEAIDTTIQQTLSTLPYRTLKEVTKRMLSDEYLNGDDLDSTKK